MDAEVKSGKVGHIICLPLPAQGHFKPLLKLAELLSEAKANDEDLDKPFTQIPGFENDFRYRDLPSGCRIANFNKTTANLFLSDQFKSASQTSALIINTFDGLEAPTISKLTSYYSKIFTVGPLHYYFQQNTQIQGSSSLLVEDNNSCLTWLDSQPSESVLFVSFGSRAILTHSGWNSTMESICAGIPMICWPFEAEQHVNSRFVSELWRIGLDMKDTCDRFIIERLVRDLFGDKREEIMKSMSKISEKAQQSVMEGGSSYCNIEKLINYIISLTP